MAKAKPDPFPRGTKKAQQGNNEYKLILFRYDGTAEHGKALDRLHASLAKAGVELPARHLALAEYALRQLAEANGIILPARLPFGFGGARPGTGNRIAKDKP